MTDVEEYEDPTLMKSIEFAKKSTTLCESKENLKRDHIEKQSQDKDKDVDRKNTSKKRKA